MKHSLIFLIGLVFLASLPVHAQWVTLTRKIKAMHTSQTDVATVIIEAKAFRVYQAVIDTLMSDPKFVITNKDKEKRLVEFTKETNKVSIQIDSLANGLSQVTVAANHSDKAPVQATDNAVEAVIKVCNKVGIKCTLDKK